MLLYTVAAALPGQGTGTFIQYNGADQTGPWGKDLLIKEDPAGNLQIGDLLATDDYMPCRSVVPNLGLTRSAFWIKATLVNAASSGNPVMLIDYPEIDELDIYVTSNGRITQALHGGDARPVDQKDRNAPSYSYELDVPYGGIVDVYIRAKSTKQLQLPIFLQNERRSTVQKLNRNFFMGGYVAIMLVMVLYNFFVSISIRERSYYLYILYLVTVCLTQVSFNGYGAFYFWPGQLWVNHHASTTLTVLTMVFACEFMQLFISADKYIRSFRKVKYAIYIVAILGAAICFFGLEQEGYQVIQATSTIMALYVLYVAIFIALKRHRPAKYFLAAWAVFVTGIIVFVAKDWGLLPYNDLTKYMMTIGSSIEVVLLSFGLADRINELRREKDRSQADALRTAREKEQFIREQNTVLEQRVMERTHALQESNDHLKLTQGQLVSAEKMASLGQLTAGIAHEINNPINFISSSIPPLKRDLNDLREVLDAYRQAGKELPSMAAAHALEERIGLEDTIREVEDILGAMEHGTTRTSEIVRGLRTFSRLDEDDLKEADINECLRSTVVVLGPQFRNGIQVEYDLREMPPVECFPGKLNQLFMNLLNNAAHAVKMRHGNTGGIVRVATRLEDGEVEVIIADNGIGMEESVKARLFEPFFTTKDVGEGTGLGLSIAQGIIEKHHGRIRVESQPGIGTTFIISFPATMAGALAKRA